MDKFKIDRHKLNYHVSRVSKWLDGENIYPVYMEISPIGACNHRCTFCALDFMEYQPRFLNPEILMERLTELGRLGLKSVMFAGEGEPLLYKRIGEVAIHAKHSGIDVAFTTNGFLLNEKAAEQILPCTEWIKVSINGGNPDVYSKVHQTSPGDFDQVIKNMERAAEIKKKNGYKCALGMQLVLLPGNRNSVQNLARLAKEIGMDYLVVKPYSHQVLSKTELYKDIKYDDIYELQKELKKFNSKEFEAILRVNPMEKLQQESRGYEKCFALPFWSYMDSGGNIWGCSIYLENEKFLYGNINENSFKEIWESNKRSDSLKWVKENLDVDNCRFNCRMDEINRYLWDLKNPPPHSNFI